ncbi:MAG: helix-turn-helix domain-containing protein [Clostridiales bacterium]|nr:helix-turn-helix domain-containing protein [Clostridiales bacterium]
MKDNTKQAITAIKEHELVVHNTINYVHFEVQEFSFCHMHAHSDIELLIVLENRLEIISESGTYEMKPGDCILFSQNTPHSCYALDDRCQLLLLQFSPIFCYEYFPDIKNIFFTEADLTHSMPKEAMDILKESVFYLGYHFSEKKYGFELRCMSALNCITNILVSLVPHDLLSNDEVISRSSTKHKMDKILSYIHENYTQKLLLQTIADKMQFTTSYLSHFFKKYMHLSFQDYLNEIRAIHAGRLLRQTNMSLIDICLESGFSDPKYLNKTFKSIYHMTPKEYRMQAPPQDTKLSQEKLTSESAADLSIRDGFRLSPQETLIILQKHHNFGHDPYNHFPFFMVD